MSTPWRLNTTNVQPPGGFRYYVSETSTFIPPNGRDPYVAFTDLLAAVQQHLKINSVPIPPNLDALIEEQICAKLANDPHWCNPGRPSTSSELTAARRGGKRRFTFNDVKQFTATVADWIMTAKGRRVSDTEITRRAAICAACPFNLDPEGCSGCNVGALTAVASRVIHGGHPADASLRSCAVCGCSLKAKVRAPVDVLLRHMPDDQLDRLPERCWLATARAEAAAEPVPQT